MTFRAKCQNSMTCETHVHKNRRCNKTQNFYRFFLPLRAFMISFPLPVFLPRSLCLAFSFVRSFIHCCFFALELSPTLSFSFAFSFSFNVSVSCFSPSLSLSSSYYISFSRLTILFLCLALIVALLASFAVLASPSPLSCRSFPCLFVSVVAHVGVHVRLHRPPEGPNINLNLTLVIVLVFLLPFIFHILFHVPY